MCPIPFSNYVDITSGVGGNNSVRQRDLITRIFTENALVPTNSTIEFDSAGEVLTYFGSSSEEYKRAQFYFGWISKNITQPQKIAYTRWANVDTDPQIFGDKSLTQAVASYTSITAGTFILTMGTEANITVGPINFTAAGSLATVAADVQTAVRAHTAGGTLWTSATVVWDSANNRFELTGGAAGAAALAVQAGVGGSDVAAQLGWLGVNAIISPGADAQTLTDLMESSTEQSNNFGSFLFIPSLTQNQIVEVATWNDDQNVRYMYLVPVTASNAAAISAALLAYSGNSVTLSPFANQYAEMAPGMILAATNYTASNSVQNYMFQIFPGLTASVTDGSTAASYDNLRVNYYGNTQNAGQIIEFYQRGTMTGASQDPVDQNVYANEMWLKDAAGAAIMTLLLSLSKVSANRYGISQILTILQGPINLALSNGTISAGKPLTDTQKIFITNVTGDDTAWQQVQNIGYWRGCVVESYVTEDGRTEYRAVYTLIYSKDDDIRKVNGSHDLI